MVEAPSKQMATTQIKSYGLLPAKVALVRTERRSAAKTATASDLKRNAKTSKKPMYFGAAVNKKALSEFTRKLSTLLQAGLTLLRSLEVLADQEKNVVFKWIINDVAEGIRSGNTFSECLGKYPKEFDFLYVNMARAGEASGMLDVSLSRLASYLEKTQKMKSKLKTAATYPTVVMSFSFLIVVALLLFVVPKFEKMFVEQLEGEPLPLLTQYVVGISSAVLEQWYLCLGGLMGIPILIKLIAATSVGRQIIDILKIRLPVFGDLNTKIYVIRFSRTLGTLIESSVPILEALRITRDTCGNSRVETAVEKVRNRVKDGEGIAHTLAATTVFPGMVSSMIEVGEETGDLPEMLTQIADVYDDEVDNSVSSMTSLVEPLMIVVLAIVVVVIVLALFLPFVKMLQAIGGG